MAATPTGQRPTIAAEAFLRALADHGIDYFFANPGTDFPPIVEAFSRAKKPMPRSQGPFWCRTRTSRSPWRTAPT
ncbi:MAG: hypothetical protein WCB32_03260 [Pseudolabrys sp.]